MLTNDRRAYYLFVGANNVRLGTLEVGDRFICDVDGEELEVAAGSVSMSSIAAQIAAAWNLDTRRSFSDLMPLVSTRLS